jgi:hypothetical protein
MIHLPARLRTRVIIAVSLLIPCISLLAVPPAWWSEGSPSVIVTGAEQNNKGVANIGQAKFVAKRALEALRAVQPVTADAIEQELIGTGKPLVSWDAPTNDEQRLKQYQPLLIGQMKAISAPFYTKLHALSPEWLEAELVANQTKDTSDPLNYFPWTSTTADDANKAPATIGQLKAVFALRFETLNPPLEAPTLAIANVTANAVSLTWGDIERESSYRIERSTDQVNFTAVATLGANVTAYTNSGLTPNTQYSYRIVAINAQEESDPSDVVVTTTPYLPPTAPASVVVSSITAHGFKVTWSAGGTNQAYYLVQVSADAGLTWTDAASVPNGQTSTVVSYLAEKTAYRVRVGAYNPTATAYSSQTVNATTLPEIPSGVTDLKVASASSTTVNLSWTDAANNETGYKVERSANGGSWSTLTTLAANSTSYSATGLTATVSYSFRVTAINVSDTYSSAFSNLASVPAMPSSPTSVVAAAQSGSTMKVTWNLPTDSTRTDVRLRSFVSGQSTARVVVDLGATATSFTDQGLAGSSSYTYQVSAVNLRGETLASTVTGTTSNDIPPAPVVTLSILGARSIRVNWTDNSSVESGFSVERSNVTATGPWTTIATLPSNSFSYTDSETLQGSSVYYYRVKAFNGHGSSYSGVIVGTTSAYPSVNRAPDAVALMPTIGASYAGVLHTTGTMFPQHSVTHAKLTSPLWVVPAVDQSGAAIMGVYNTTAAAFAAGGTVKPSGTWDANQEYGSKVVTSGNLIFVSAPSALKTAGNTSSARCGAVYIFEWTGSAVTELGRITPTDGSAGDRFGDSIAVDDNKLIIGSPFKDVTSGGIAYADAGKVYLYERATNGVWNLVKDEISIRPETDLHFGASVAVRGQCFVVGAPNQDGLLSLNGGVVTIADVGAIAFGHLFESPGKLVNLRNPLFLEIDKVDPGSVSGLAGAHFGASLAMDSYLGLLVGVPDHTWSSSNSAMAPYFGGNLLRLGWNGKIGDACTLHLMRLPLPTTYNERLGKTIKWDEVDKFFYATSANRCYSMRLSLAGDTGMKCAEVIGYDANLDPISYTVVSGPVPTVNLTITPPLSAGAEKFEVVKDSNNRSYLLAKEGAGLTSGSIYSIGVRAADDRGGAKDFQVLVRIVGESTFSDQDNDGMDDAWETNYGLNPADPLDAASFAGGDGLSAKDHYLRYKMGMAYGVDPTKWDLNPDGDEDGDGVVNKQDVDPFASSIGALNIQILQPGTGGPF